MQHSIKLYENIHPLRIKTQIINVIERLIKFHRAGRTNMATTLGIVLAKTIFQPQSLTQPADKGAINKVPVLTVTLEKAAENHEGLATIYHFLDPEQIRNKQFRIGQTVELQIDAAFRRQRQLSCMAGQLITELLQFHRELQCYQPEIIHRHHFPGAEYIKVAFHRSFQEISPLVAFMNDELKTLVQTKTSVLMSCKTGGEAALVKENQGEYGVMQVMAKEELREVRVTHITLTPKELNKVELTIFYAC